MTYSDPSFEDDSANQGPECWNNEVTHNSITNCETGNRDFLEDTSNDTNGFTKIIKDQLNKFSFVPYQDKSMTLYSISTIQR